MESKPISVEEPLLIKTEENIAVQTKVIRKAACSIRFFVLLLLAIIALMLVGYIAATIFHIKNSGTAQEINEMSTLNAKLKEQDLKFRQDNAELKQEVQDLVALNKQLSDEVVQFRIQNDKFLDGLASLNDTNKELKNEVEDLKVNELDLRTEVSKFKNETDALSGQQEQLDQLEQNLTLQLDQFSTLRQEVANYSHERQESLEKVIDETLNLFSNVSYMNMMNDRTNFLNVAVDLQFLDFQPGLNQFEYERFMEESSHLLSTDSKQLLTQYPFDTQPKNDQGEVSLTAVANIVDGWLQNKAKQLNAQFLQMYDYQTYFQTSAFNI